LQAIRCEQWLDLVFVNLSGDAPPLADYLQPMRDRWSTYDLNQLRREPREVGLTCNANWKLADRELFRKLSPELGTSCAQ
jgi:choline monooxygenase